MLKQYMDQIELIEKQQTACLTHWEELTNKYFAKKISLLCIIPGIQKFSAYVILSEIGKDRIARGCARATFFATEEVTNWDHGSVMLHGRYRRLRGLHDGSRRGIVGGKREILPVAKEIDSAYFLWLGEGITHE
jgi:hypothetical protein